jgi:hypothetical protein
MRDDGDDVADYGRHEDKNGNEADDKTTSGGMIKTGTGYCPNTSTNGLLSLFYLSVCLSGSSTQDVRVIFFLFFFSLSSESPLAQAQRNIWPLISSSHVSNPAPLVGEFCT